MGSGVSGSLELSSDVEDEQGVDAYLTAQMVRSRPMVAVVARVLRGMVGLSMKPGALVSRVLHLSGRDVVAYSGTLLGLLVVLLLVRDSGCGGVMVLVVHGGGGGGDGEVAVGEVWVWVGRGWGWGGEGEGGRGEGGAAHTMALSSFRWCVMARVSFLALLSLLITRMMLLSCAAVRDSRRSLIADLRLTSWIRRVRYLSSISIFNRYCFHDFTFLMCLFLPLW